MIMNRFCVLAGLEVCVNNYYLFQPKSTNLVVNKWQLLILHYHKQLYLVSELKSSFFLSVETKC